MRKFSRFDETRRARCLVPRPHFSSRPKRFRSRGPCENVFSARSPRIRHRNELTERHWENAVRRLGKRARWSRLIFSMCVWLSNRANWVWQGVAFSELCQDFIPSYKQDAVWAYIWAWSYYWYDTLNMPYCSKRTVIISYQRRQILHSTSLLNHTAYTVCPNPQQK